MFGAMEDLRVALYVNGNLNMLMIERILNSHFHITEFRQFKSRAQDNLVFNELSYKKVEAIFIM